MSRVLVVSNDVVARRMAGPGIRSLELARQLSASGATVTLAAPPPVDLAGAGVAIVTYSRATLPALAREHDVVVIQGWVLADHPGLAAGGARLVVDLYDPFQLEGLTQPPGRDVAVSADIHRRTLGVLNAQLRRGDFFICASERQRDFWLGALSGLNRVNPATHHQDSTLRRLIDVVPFGIPEAPPRHHTQVMRGIVPGISAGDLVLLWGGGLYDWFDPLTMVRGVALAAPHVPLVRLLFHAGRHPNPVVPEMEIVQRARRLAEELDVLGRHVFFNRQWVEYESRADWLLEADVGVSSHVNHVETQFSFRTRMLDYLWAGLPILCTEGDTLGDLVRQRGLGVAVPEASPTAVADAIVQLADPGVRAEYAERVRAAASEYTWRGAVGPLARYCAEPWAAADLASRRGRPMPVPLRARPDRPGPLGDLERAADDAAAQVRSARRAYRRGGAAALVAGARARLGRRPPDTDRGLGAGGAQRLDAGEGPDAEGSRDATR